MSDQKWCPFTRVYNVQVAHNRLPDGMPTRGSECIKRECAMWQEVYTTERMRTSGCILALGPMLNSDGKLPV